MTSKRTKRRRVREELEFLYDEDNESLDLSTNNIESHILTSVVNTNDNVEHITTKVVKKNYLNIGNISPEVCIYFTIYYCITLLMVKYFFLSLLNMILLYWNL